MQTETALSELDTMRKILHMPPRAQLAWNERLIYAEKLVLLGIAKINGDHRARDSWQTFTLTERQRIRRAAVRIGEIASELVP